MSMGVCMRTYVRVCVSQVVVASDPWLDGLPNSIEAIFLVACRDGDRNVKYHGSGAADHVGTSPSCGEARACAPVGCG